MNIIDSGEGAGIDIDTLSPIETFSFEGFDTTNGVATTYFITWFTEIDTMNDDYIEVNLAAELKLNSKNAANDEIICDGLNGISKVYCEKDDKNDHLLKIYLQKVTQSTGLYKISLDTITNAPSLRGSSEFGEIIQKTK